MFYIFPPITITIILILDLVIILLTAFFHKININERKYGILLIFMLFIPSFGLKILSNSTFLFSSPVTITVSNDVKPFSPVYVIRRNQISWVFLTIHGIPTSHHVEGESGNGYIAIFSKGKYGYINFDINSKNSSYKFTESDLSFDNHEMISNTISEYSLILFANYSSHIITFLFLLIILYQFLVYLWKLLSKRKNHIRAISEIRG